MRHRHSRHRTKIIIGMAILVIIGAGLFVYYKLFSGNDTTPLKTASQPDKVNETAKPKTIQISLPGADPVDAIIEDYDDPTSLWVVVNKDHPLAQQDYRPSDLVFLKDDSRTDKSQDERSLREVAVADYHAMMTDALAAGYDLMIGSGFRSYNQQKIYYTNYVAKSGEAAANKYSAKPGYSEHQTGLTADVAPRTRECYISLCFGDMPAGQWMAANSYKYGFIIRYPADKTEITQYQYEPWHIRYVGIPLATALHQSGLTLDEAYPYLQTARDELIRDGKITVQP